MKRLSDLEERLERAERTLRGLALDQDDLFDRWKTMNGRIAKRYAADHNAEASASTEAEEAATTSLSASPTWAKLTARQKQIQMQILHRRGNGG